MGYPNVYFCTLYRLVLLFLVSLLVLRFPCLEGRRSLKATKGPHIEVAMIGIEPSPGTRFYGGRAFISLWNPFVSEEKDFSSSSMRVKITKDAYLEAGWTVSPDRHSDFQSRFFVYWTTDDSVETGCFDLDCDGFVVFDENSIIGAPVSTSTIGAATYKYLDVFILQMPETGHWSLSVGETVIGYWPASLFTGLPSGAKGLRWGGSVYDSIGNGTHTDTNMGNGLFPDPATGHASHVCSLRYRDSPNSTTLRTPDRDTLWKYVTNELCYDAQSLPVTNTEYGLCFLFGGSGRSARCP